MTEGKTIGNVNILDLRKTTEETIASIRKVGNVNIILYSPETSSFLARLDIGNVNSSVEVPANAKLQTTMGNVLLSPDSLRTAEGPMFHLIMGNATIDTQSGEAAVSEELEDVAGLIIMGNVICPESLSGVIEPKIKQLMGNFTTYPDDAMLVAGSLDLTIGFLERMEKPCRLVVTGSVRVLEDVSEAVERKIEYLQVGSGVICSEANADAIRSKLQGGASRLIVIPDGYRFHEGDLTLDAAAVGSLSQAKLFCTGKVILKTDIDPATVGPAIDGLRALGLILCPAGLKDELQSKLDFVEDRILFYEGDLWLFDDEHQLHASRFEYSEGKATALVIGELTIEPDVAPDVLANRFHAIHNLGEIRCTPEQMGAIEARLGVHEGDLLDSTPKEKEKYDIGNANVLTL